MLEQLGPIIIYPETSADRDAETNSLDAGAEGAWGAFMDSNPWPDDTSTSRRTNADEIKDLDLELFKPIELSALYEKQKAKRS